jgi:hypothetical protein
MILLGRDKRVQRSEFLLRSLVADGCPGSFDFADALLRKTSAPLRMTGFCVSAREN